MFVTSVANEARLRSRALLSSQQQASRLMSSLCWKYGMTSVVDISECGTVARLAALQRFEHLLARRTCSAERQSVSLGESLRGQQVVLGYSTCLDTFGHVQLCSLDVPEKWTEVCKVTPSLYPIRLLVDHAYGFLYLCVHKGNNPFVYKKSVSLFL